MTFWSGIMAAEKKLEQVNYYELLGVKKTASTGEIEDRYYSLASRFHPDRFAASGNSVGLAALTRIYARVGEAKNILLDANARREYDTGLAVGVIRIREVTPKTRAISQEDPSNPTAQSLLAKATIAESAGDLRSAISNLQLALQFEASSSTLQLRLESVRNKLGRGDVLAAKRAAAKLMAARLMALGRPKPTAKETQETQRSRAEPTAQRSEPIALTLPKEEEPTVQRSEPTALTFLEEPIALTLPEEKDDEPTAQRSEPIVLTLLEDDEPIAQRSEPIALTLLEDDEPTAQRSEPIALTLLEDDEPTAQRSKPIALTFPGGQGDPSITFLEKEAGEPPLLKEAAPDRVRSNSPPTATASSGSRPASNLADQETAEEESYDSYDFELPDAELGILELSDSDSVEVEATAPEPKMTPLLASAAPFSLGELVGEYLRLRQLPVHSILGVDAKASAVQARAAYESLVRLYHPHNNDAAGDTERMKVCRDLVGIVVKAYKEI